MRILLVLLTMSLLLEQASTASIHRSMAQRAAFVRDNPCPAPGSPKHSCPGYVVDHVIPLCAGGADAPENMQWQEHRESLVKDRWEWKMCDFLHTPRDGEDQ